MGRKKPGDGAKPPRRGGLRRKAPLNPGTKPLKAKRPWDRSASARKRQEEGTGPPRRSGPIKRVRTGPHQTAAEAGEKPPKAKRSQRKREGVYGPYHKWVKGFPCILRGCVGHRCWGPVTGHHLKTVGSGGVDWSNEVPICEGSHAELHQIGYVRFAEKFGVSLEDMETIAFQLAETWRREGRGEPVTRNQVRRRKPAA